MKRNSLFVPGCLSFGLITFVGRVRSNNEIIYHIFSWAFMTAMAIIMVVGQLPSKNLVIVSTALGLGAYGLSIVAL